MMEKFLRRVRGWTFLRLMLVCAGWFVLCVVVLIAWGIAELYWVGAFSAGAGSGGIGAVSAGLPEALIELAMVFVPIVALVSVWVWQRFLRTLRRTV
jgi:hypothetical protein